MSAGGIAGRLARLVALLRDPRTPALPKLLVAAACLYLLWPADLVPDFLFPVLGYLDDATLLWLTLRWLVAGRGEEGRDSPGPPRG